MSVFKPGLDTVQCWIKSLKMEIVTRRDDVKQNRRFACLGIISCSMEFCGTKLHGYGVNIRS